MGYDDGGGKGFDITLILLPLLAILGLSLLFPTVTSISVTGRRKRSTDVEEEGKTRTHMKNKEGISATSGPKRVT